MTSLHNKGILKGGVRNCNRWGCKRLLAFVRACSRLLAFSPPRLFAFVNVCLHLSWELKDIYHHHPESKKRKSSEGNSGSIHPYGRYGNAGKTSKSISTIAILWPVKAIFEKRAATVEVDTSISPVVCVCSHLLTPPFVVAPPSACL